MGRLKARSSLCQIWSPGASAIRLGGSSSGCSAAELLSGAGPLSACSRAEQVLVNHGQTCMLVHKEGTLRGRMKV